MKNIIFDDSDFDSEDDKIKKVSSVKPKVAPPVKIPFKPNKI